MEFMTREQAKALGLPRYISGKACRRGHQAERRTNDGKCIPCEAEWSIRRASEKAEERAAYQKRYRADKTEAIAQQRKQYRTENADKVADLKRASHQRRKPKVKEYLAKNADRIREADRLRKQKNAEKIRQQKKAWRAANIQAVTEREVAYRAENAARIAEVSRQYKSTHRAEMTALTAARRARIMQATPPWADFDEIKEIYLEAGRQGKQVDHVIPLTHPLVCGLHVQTNMQLLTRSENAKKRNKFTPG